MTEARFAVELRTLARARHAHKCRRSEARHVADLGDHEHRRVAPDAADLAQHLHALVSLRARVDLPVVAVISRSKSPISAISCPSAGASRPAAPAREELASALAEQV